jgi:ATP-dependent RNA helicase RhlE|tara:strand:- start:29327 stop:29986 length:660 start_codon:yes stop_codon:yes gene_type:complete
MNPQVLNPKNRFITRKQMAFKKLQETLIENLTAAGYTDFLPEQKLLFSKIREGKNLVVLTEGGKGLSSLFLMTALHKVPEPEEGSPRVVIICATDDEAQERYEDLKKWSRHMDLTIDLAHERGKQIQQRNDIFDGTEIVIGTTKRIYDLYIQSGLNLNLLRLFIIDDANQTLIKNNPGFLARFADSLPKCQILIGAKSYNEKLEAFCEQIPFGFTKVKM